MRFVTPEVVRIPLSNGTDWIEVKRELTVGEDKRYRTAGMSRMRPGTGGTGDDATASIDVDFAKMAFARAVAYIVDWSEKRALSPAALENLHPDDFAEIDAAIVKHIGDVSESKKLMAGVPQPAAT